VISETVFPANLMTGATARKIMYKCMTSVFNSDTSYYFTTHFHSGCFAESAKQSCCKWKK